MTVKDKDTRTVVIMPESLKRKFKLACVAKNLDMSDVLRELVEQWLEKPDKK